MGIMSSSVSITQYKVEGELKKPILENIYIKLNKNRIREINNRSLDKSIGWSCFDNPFSTDFSKFPFLIGTNIVFSMRIDKKIIPAKMIKKEFITKVNKQFDKNGHFFISKEEKKDIKKQIVYTLNINVPATPNVYDILWKYEEKHLLFFSTSKNTNEELESLFYKSFNMRLTKLFPFTMAQSTLNLSDSEKDALVKLSPTRFTE